MHCPVDNKHQHLLPSGILYLCTSCLAKVCATCIKLEILSAEDITLICRACKEPMALGYLVEQLDIQLEYKSFVVKRLNLIIEDSDYHSKDCTTKSVWPCCCFIIWLLEQLQIIRDLTSHTINDPLLKQAISIMKRVYSIIIQSKVEAGLCLKYKDNIDLSIHHAVKSCMLKANYSAYINTIIRCSRIKDHQKELSIYVPLMLDEINKQL